jgi:gliding motility-associated protein GldM
MAGGKETPRQKMIGMMYLVLTALLALNVSSAILEKFAMVNTTLEELVKEDLTKNESKLKGIMDAKSTEAKVTAAKEKANKVREITKVMVTYLDGVKKKIKTDGNKQLEGEELVLNTNNPEEVMLNSNHPEIGTEYEKRLKGYVKDLNDIMQLKNPFPKLNKKAVDFDEFKNDPHQTGKDFLQFSFEGTPAMAAVAILSQMQTEVLEDESAALDTLNAIAEGVTYKVDQLVAMVDADANSIVAGNDYQGNLFVAGAASGVVPEMFKDGIRLPLEDVEVGLSSKVKMGKIKFRVGASNYDANGIAKSSFKVKINLPGRPPIDRTIDYKIIKPTAIFGSAAAATLYRDCGTEVNVTIPALTDLSALDLNVPTEQGKAYKLAPGKFAILPTRGQCNVSVLLGGQAIQVQKFETQDVPPPVAKLLSGPNTIDIAKGVPTGTASIRIEPEILDQIFAKNNQKDNKYYVSGLILQIDGGSPITIRSGSIPLSQYNLRKGQSISISQVQVQRQAYDGTTKQVNGSKMNVSCRIN